MLLPKSIQVVCNDKNASNLLNFFSVLEYIAFSRFLVTNFNHTFLQKYAYFVFLHVELFHLVHAIRHGIDIFR